MAFERTKFGMEYNPRSFDGGESSGLGCLIAAIAAVAAVSLGWAVISRLRESARVEEAVAVAVRQETVPKAEERPKPALPDGLKPIRDGATDVRPTQVRNLLQRLEEAERRGDIEMAAATIEKLRSLPGQGAADLDDQLARRLGAFNMKRLFESRNPQWVADVEVKSGDFAIRIAREHGGTFASLQKLNPQVNFERLKVGQKLKVMASPRFTLVVRRRSRIADLVLNGKFFARYDLLSDVKAETGLYNLGAKARQFFAERGMVFSQEARRELELLLPPGAQVSVSEM
jgi:LysM repeat protein